MTEESNIPDRTDEFLTDPYSFVQRRDAVFFTEKVFGESNAFTADIRRSRKILGDQTGLYSGKLGNRIVAKELFGTSVLYEDGELHLSLREAMADLFRPKRKQVVKIVESILASNGYYEEPTYRSNLHFFFQVISLQVTLSYFNDVDVSQFGAAKLVRLVDRLSKGLFVAEGSRNSNPQYESALRARDVLLRQATLNKSGRLRCALSARGFRDDLIVDQLITLMFAGVDTMSSTLSWAIEKIILGDGVTPSAREAIHLSLIERPPVYFIPRGTSKKTRIDDQVFEAGQVVNVMVCTLHEQIGGDEGSGHFIPFGLGNKKCPGQSFSLMAMDHLLTTLTEDFKVELVGGDLSKASFVPGQRPACPPSLVLSPNRSRT